LGQTLKPSRYRSGRVRPQTPRGFEVLGSDPKALAASQWLGQTPDPSRFRSGWVRPQTLRGFEVVGSDPRPFVVSKWLGQTPDSSRFRSVWATPQTLRGFKVAGSDPGPFAVSMCLRHVPDPGELVLQVCRSSANRFQCSKCVARTGTGSGSRSVSAELEPVQGLDVFRSSSTALPRFCALLFPPLT